MPSAVPLMRAIAVRGVLCLVLLVGFPPVAASLEILAGPDGQVSAQSLSLPYAFYNENFGTAVGYVYGTSDFHSGNPRCWRR